MLWAIAFFGLSASTFISEPLNELGNWERLRIGDLPVVDAADEEIRNDLDFYRR
jgi:hypothetical protein